MKKSFLFFLMSTIVFISINESDLKANENNPADSTTISFTENLHDYGTIKKGSDGTYAFTFKNTGNIPLVLTNVGSSCGCTIPSWPKEPVAPGKTGEINVKYDTNRLGNFRKTITVYSNAKAVVLTITGTVQE